MPAATARGLLAMSRCQACKNLASRCAAARSKAVFVVRSRLGLASAAGGAGVEVAAVVAAVGAWHRCAAVAGGRCLRAGGIASRNFLCTYLPSWPTLET